MLFREHQPPLRLKPYVRYYWTLQLGLPPAAHSSMRMLAEGFEFTFNMADTIEIINCDGRVKHISASGITGPMSRPMRIRSTGTINVFGICFHPGGGYPFFKYPAHEMVDLSTDTDDLWGAKGRAFVEHIHNDCGTTQARIEAVNAYLSRCLKSNLREDVVTQKAIETIESCKGRIAVEQLARQLGLSSRHLARKFKEQIGMSPKHLCRNIRFKQVYKRIEASSHYNWADVALAFGYYDQSHFINEFKYFTGKSPETYFLSSPNGPDFFSANF
jgi:AraC-like DNA-binding protein